MNINKRLKELEVSSKYGAPMGRSRVMENETACVHVQKVIFVDGDYDMGGAYWGGGEDSVPLWSAMDEEGEVMLFTRANTRGKAIKDFKEKHPGLVILENGSIDVDIFTHEYATAALWSSTDEDEYPLDRNYTVDDIHPDSLALMRKDCEQFIQENMQDLLTWRCHRYSVEEMGGHDFWLTRNGHGSGFWDGDWEKEVGKRLTKASKQFGEQYLYVDDNGKVRVG
jgi:hypothetical protein